MMPDWEESRIKRMEMVLRDFCQEEKRNEDTLGLLLFGSLATKKISPDSDIDILVVAKHDGPRTRLIFRGEIIDKVAKTATTIDDYISKGFSIDWLTEGEILYDPYGELARLKTKAETFAWSQDQISKNEKSAEKYLTMAEELSKHDLQSSLFLLHKASEEYLRSLAKRNGVKTNVDIGDFFKVVRLKERSFCEFFREIQGLGGHSRLELEAYLSKLEYKKWDRLDWNISKILREAENKKLNIEEIGKELLPVWNKVPTSSLHSAGDSLREGDLECALLYLREASFWYAKVEKRAYETLLTRLIQTDPEYYPLFLEINGLTQVEERELQQHISSMKRLLLTEKG